MAGQAPSVRYVVFPPGSTDAAGAFDTIKAAQEYIIANGGAGWRMETVAV